MSEAKFKVENSEQLTALLNRMHHVVRNKAVMEGMKAGANMINSQARAKLQGRIIGKGNYNFNNAFKSEPLKGKTPDEVGIRTGVWDKKNGYILRWLEWGTAERTTFKRFNRVTNTTTEPMSRGKMAGYGYFFGTIRDNTDEIFKVVSDAIIKSLEELTAAK